MARIDMGLVLPQRAILFGAADWTDLFDLARAADRDARFGSVWVGDSIMAKARPDALTTLGALAAITGRVRLGVGCMASFPLRDPVVFAAQWASLDSLSDGRMRLAVCTGIGLGGTSAREGAIWGVRDTERGARMAENMEICRRLWSEDDVSFAGRFRSFDHATIRPRPTQRPCPIWIAANPRPSMAEKPLRRVAQIADGFMLAQVWPGLFAALWPKLERYLRDEGRDPDGFPTVAYMNINIARDRQSALAETMRFLEEYYGPVFSPEMTAAWTAAGTPAQCAAHLRRPLHAGPGQPSFPSMPRSTIREAERAANRGWRTFLIPSKNEERPLCEPQIRPAVGSAAGDWPAGRYTRRHRDQGKPEHKTQADGNGTRCRR